MREYVVTIPIAGHAFVTVEANNEEEAEQIAFDTVSTEHLEEWEALREFNRGNVCYCPTPWSIEVEDCGEVDQ